MGSLIESDVVSAAVAVAPAWPHEQMASISMIIAIDALTDRLAMYLLMITLFVVDVRLRNCVSCPEHDKTCKRMKRERERRVQMRLLLLMQASKQSQIPLPYDLTGGAYQEFQRQRRFNTEKGQRRTVIERGQVMHATTLTRLIIR